MEKGAQLSEQDVIEFCRDRMAVYKAPRYVEFSEGLPRNPAGKVLKRELRSESRSERRWRRNDRIAGNETSWSLAISHKRKPDD